MNNIRTLVHNTEKKLDINHNGSRKNQKYDDREMVKTLVKGLAKTIHSLKTTYIRAINHLNILRSRFCQSKIQQSFWNGQKEKLMNSKILWN